MHDPNKPLGILRPLGGGDPIPLLKEEILIGRRRSCDIRLDYDNISGKHCVLRFVRGVWHVRDLNSTNGTTVSGQRVDHDHSVLPDDELGLATHYFAIDYDPIAPSSLLDANMVLEEEMAEPRRTHSLMELAGLDSDSDRRARRTRPERAPERIIRKSAADDDFDDELPTRSASGSNEPHHVAASDEDFFNLIKGEIESDS